MRTRLAAIGIGIAVVLILLYSSIFVVDPSQQALVLQWGNIQRAVETPGPNLKVPFIQDVLLLDKRILDLSVPSQEIIASDQKRLVVDAFTRYRISNPVLFYQSVNNVTDAARRLNTYVVSALRAVLADATFIQIVRDERPVLMERIRQAVAGRARELGIDVVDVRIRRADLPQANSQAIYRRMQTERQQEATQIRAEGAAAAQRIRAQADRQAVVIKAEADKQSEQIRGDGDAGRNAIFADAYQRDPDFFAFYRSMQAYQKSLQPGGTRFVIAPDSDFFRFFSDPNGTPRQGSQHPLAAPSPGRSPAGLPGPAASASPVAPTLAGPGSTPGRATAAAAASSTPLPQGTSGTGPTAPGTLAPAVAGVSGPTALVDGMNRVGPAVR